MPDPESNLVNKPQAQAPVVSARVPFPEGVYEFIIHHFYHLHR